MKVLTRTRWTQEPSLGIDGSGKNWGTSATSQVYTILPSRPPFACFGPPFTGFLTAMLMRGSSAGASTSTVEWSIGSVDSKGK